MLRRRTDARTHGRTLGASVRLCVCASSLLVAACAQSGDPPGGPPDQTPPHILRFEPDSGAVLTSVPSEVNIYFDEVISERTTGQPSDIGGAVILSPSNEPDRVSWRRDHISIRPKRGYQPGRIYRIELLPVISDLRNNKMRGGRTIVFSTGPAIPSGVVEGTVVDWVQGKPAARALIEAVLMPDSLVYRSIADSGGVFRMEQMPPGHYRVYGVLDQNNDRRRGPRETYDSIGVDVDTVSAPVELFAFVRDTTGPRIRQTEVVDSLTLKITFDRPLDPTLALDTSMVTVAPLDDSTRFMPLVTVTTQKGFDSLKTRLADSVTAAHAAADTTRARADTTRPRPDSLRPDTTHRDTTHLRAPRDTTQRRRPPLDSTRAEKMLARRPPPTDVRIVRLAEALVPDTRYVIHVNGARSLSGNENSARSQIRAPRPSATRSTTTRSDTTRSDSTRNNATRSDTTRSDTTRARPRP